MASYIKQLKDSTGTNSYYPVTLGNAVYLSTDTNTNLETVVNTLDSEKADLNSPNLTGTPTAPTAASGTSTTQIATTAFVMDAMSSGGGGTEIVVSETQPASQSTGSFWYKVI